HPRVPTAPGRGRSAQDAGSRLPEQEDAGPLWRGKGHHPELEGHSDRRGEGPFAGERRGPRASGWHRLRSQRGEEGDARRARAEEARGGIRAKAISFSKARLVTSPGLFVLSRRLGFVGFHVALAVAVGAVTLLDRQRLLSEAHRFG